MLVRTVANAARLGGLRTSGAQFTGSIAALVRLRAASPPMRALPAAATLPLPDPAAAAHSEQVAALIRREIDATGGWISFDRYMQLTLYAPGLGYYTAGAHKLGDSAAGGDFVTAPEISPLFGQALAAQIAEVFEHTAHRILEFGAGSGTLARDLLAELARCGVAVEQYAIVEVSADLRDRQRARLAAHPEVTWLDAPPAGFEGVIIANEVLDVMPVRLFVRGADDAPASPVFERGVAWRDGGFVFAERAADTSLLAAVHAIEATVGPLRAGYGSEVSPVVTAWAAQLAHWLARGVALLIDYGFPRREYYHPQRLMGTLMCHYRHHAHADPLWLPGLNDITAHVDFTAVADAAHVAGLDVLGYTTQAHFLINCGLLDLVQRSAGTQRHQRAAEAQRLLSEAEMGELFKVLAVGRGIAAPLRGFARGDRLHTLD
jgi:SAM-dependent MidA family methyltransferase